MGLHLIWLARLIATPPHARTLAYPHTHLTVNHIVCTCFMAHYEVTIFDVYFGSIFWTSKGNNIRQCKSCMKMSKVRSFRCDMCAGDSGSDAWFQPLSAKSIRERNHHGTTSSCFSERYMGSSIVNLPFNVRLFAADARIEPLSAI